MDNLEKFVKDLLDGKLKAYLKSEPIPESNDDPVKVGKMSKLEAATAFHNFMCSEFKKKNCVNCTLKTTSFIFFPAGYRS